MKPEDRARLEIDRQLEECGWVVQDHKAMNIMAGPGVAVREFPPKKGFGDYEIKVGMVQPVQRKPVLLLDKSGVEQLLRLKERREQKRDRKELLLKTRPGLSRDAARRRVERQLAKETSVS